MGSIQLGIQHAVGGLASKPERDLLMQDFMTVETTNFPSEGSNHTPAHHYSEFKFKNYAPIAFRYFRDLFGIQPDDFLVSKKIFIRLERMNMLVNRRVNKCCEESKLQRVKISDVNVQCTIARIIKSWSQWKYFLPHRG